LADYRDHYEALRGTGANVAAVSVDPPEKSEALRIELSLQFPILCDTENRVVRDWDIYNSREKGGIAKPAVFILDPGLVCRYASVDTVAKRVQAAEIVSLLQTTARAQPARRCLYVPSLSDCIRGIRNLIRR
jgi:peroxiredoxin